MQIASKPDGRLPKAPRGGGRVKQSQGLVARGWLWGISLAPSPSVSSCLPIATDGGFPHGIPCNHSQDKYLLSSYYVPGAREMAESKADTEPTLMELRGQQGRKTLLN